MATATIKAKDGAARSHGEIRIHTWAVFEEFVHGPSYCFIPAEFYTDIFTSAAFARRGLTIYHVEVVGI
jgi:hypothetical protein